MESMTISEYAALRGCTTKNVYNFLYRNKKPAGVIDFKRSGKNGYILFVKKSAVKKIKK